LGEGRELVADAPELREEDVVDQPAQHFDGGALGADDGVADHACDDLVVPDPPEVDPLVELDHRLGELVELLVLPAARVDVDEREPRLLPQRVERLPERRHDAAHLPPAGRVEAAAVPEHLPDLLVLPRRHLLEHVELVGRVAEAQRRAPQQPERRGNLAVLQMARRGLDVVPRELQPELGRLVDGLEEELVAVHPLVRRLLQREQLVGVQVPLVVARGTAREDGLREVLVRRHGLSILPV
jgi:hypothetical protein